mmetsp:Transcript_16302/g.40170  ORF Transcript_16302/g.40170 Transcript_16302/m.40170 type:complete len:784 (+) Transcript_16302:2720-5071(+)
MPPPAAVRDPHEEPVRASSFGSDLQSRWGGRPAAGAILRLVRGRRFRDDLRLRDELEGLPHVQALLVAEPRRAGPDELRLHPDPALSLSVRVHDDDVHLEGRAGLARRARQFEPDVVPARVHEERRRGVPRLAIEIHHVCRGLNRKGLAGVAEAAPPDRDLRVAAPVGLPSEPLSRDGLADVRSSSSSHPLPPPPGLLPELVAAAPGRRVAADLRLHRPAHFGLGEPTSSEVLRIHRGDDAWVAALAPLEREAERLEALARLLLLLRDKLPLRLEAPFRLRLLLLDVHCALVGSLLLLPLFVVLVLLPSGLANGRERLDDLADLLVRALPVRGGEGVPVLLGGVAVQEGRGPMGGADAELRPPELLDREPVDVGVSLDAERLLAVRGLRLELHAGAPGVRVVGDLEGYREGPVAGERLHLALPDLAVAGVPDRVLEPHVRRVRRELAGALLDELADVAFDRHLLVRLVQPAVVEGVPDRAAGAAQAVTRVPGDDFVLHLGERRGDHHVRRPMDELERGQTVFVCLREGFALVLYLRAFDRRARSEVRHPGGQALVLEGPVVEHVEREVGPLEAELEDRPVPVVLALAPEEVRDLAGHRRPALGMVVVVRLLAWLDGQEDPPQFLGCVVEEVFGDVDGERLGLVAVLRESARLHFEDVPEERIAERLFAVAPELVISRLAPVSNLLVVVDFIGRDYQLLVVGDREEELGLLGRERVERHNLIIVTAVDTAPFLLLRRLGDLLHHHRIGALEFLSVLVPQQLLVDCNLVSGPDLGLIMVDLNRIA